MKVKTNKTIYQCDFCKKNMLRIDSMKKHEEYCYANPKNATPCNDCMHLEETVNEYQDEYDNIRTSKSFKCAKTGKTLYPLVVLRKGLIDKHPESFEGQERMPQSCEFEA